MKLRDQVGLNIQNLRRERGISQEDLALMAKVNRGYMGKLENAKYSASLDMIEKISRALNVEPSVLLARDSDLQVSQRLDPSGQPLLPTKHNKKNAGDLKSKPIRLRAKPFQEGVIFTKGEAVVVWKDYTWNTGEISRYWTPGFEADSDLAITVRKIEADQSDGT